MAEAMKKIPNISEENTPEKKDSLAENIKGLTGEELDIFYDKMVNIINGKKAEMDKLELELDKNANTNVYNLDIHKRTKEITNLEKMLKLIVHEMSRRIQIDYKNNNKK
jgi:folate-dependent tRNA-U54 methylase TrmFO/GidA